MAHKRHHKKIVRHGTYKTKAEAEVEARKLRAEGHETRIRRDPFTGKFIVEIIILALAFGFLGAAFRR